MNMLITGVLHEVESELEKTIRILANLDDNKKDWKPHEKSMSTIQLARHIVELQTGFRNSLKNDSFDFEKDYKPYACNTFNELSAVLKKETNAFINFIKETEQEFWLETFTLRVGKKVIVALPRIAFFRSIIMNHLIHHRGQLTVYLRLLDIPVPGIYGPSADEK